MNARKVQIEFSEFAAETPVTLDFIPVTGGGQADMQKLSFGSPSGQTVAGTIREAGPRLHEVLTPGEPFSGHAQPVRWGINE